MNLRDSIRTTVLASIVATLTSSAGAEEGRFKNFFQRLPEEYADLIFHNRAEIKKRTPKPLTPYQNLKRAGKPHRLSRSADYTYGPRYCGYYIGGGAALYGKPGILHGEPRFRDEGTFGMDYNPWWSRVRLQWFHGQRYQDGEGQYEADRTNNPFAHLFGR